MVLVKMLTDAQLCACMHVITQFFMVLKSFTGLILFSTCKVQYLTEVIILLLAAYL